MIERNQVYIQSLANIRSIEILDDFPKKERFLKGVVGSWEVGIPLEGIFDLEQEKRRLEKKISKISSDVEKLENRLGNGRFLSRAPDNVVQETKNRLRELQNRKIKLEEGLKNIPAR
jgi:valyl-tRNA synthetase